MEVGIFGKGWFNIDLLFLFFLLIDGGINGDVLGDVEHTHLVKGLDYALLNKVRSEIDKKPDSAEDVDGKSRYVCSFFFCFQSCKFGGVYSDFNDEYENFS